MKIKSYKDLEKIRKESLSSLYPLKPKITVGMASCGLAAGAGETYEAIESEITNRKLDAILTKTGCLGFCQMEPLVEILEPGKPKLIYKNMTHDKVEKLIDSFIKGKIAEDLILLRIDKEEISVENDVKKHWSSDISDEIKNEINKVPLYKEIPFFKKQKKIALRNCGFIDPEDIKEYIAKGGYYALYKALNEMFPDEVIEEVKNSKLRGRGGAGFPTGLKWEFTKKAKGNPKYIVCNADEGDPGAFMDRGLIEGDPHSLLEGMLIAGYAIGAKEGYIYCRAEYPLAIHRLKIAIGQAKEIGLIGKNIFRTDYNFDISIKQGAGAFVCGEETALLASIEGRRGEPRPRPPFPATSGLWGKPTNINNVKSYSYVPQIILNGAQWFSSMGTDRSKGTMVFALTGKVKYTGLVEVPIGMTLGELVNDVGGGVLTGKKFKAVQIGGPLGGCLPIEKLDTPIDYEPITEAGAIMGSGGVIVVDEDTCMVEFAKFFLKFASDEGCGQCVPCRIGGERMLEILTKITEGKGELEDLEKLEKLARVMNQGSLCALGQLTPNPVTSTLRYFRDEYITHIVDKKCPAGECEALIKLFINEEKCTGCGVCIKSCPQDAITGEKKKPHKIDQGICIKCGICEDVCKFDAIYVV
jgi:NADH:ubiquinone oxidoreductase subunit F (NADH-binding)/NAD-dependent dihydropyrimidine dehydrogenase PreA subunit/(2Fe-2S) ferredoxin